MFLHRPGTGTDGMSAKGDERVSPMRGWGRAGILKSLTGALRNSDYSWEKIGQEKDVREESELLRRT
jgi:hypothetical protein